jgi:hypothetical protein
MKNSKMPPFETNFLSATLSQQHVTEKLSEFIGATASGDFLKQNLKFLSYLTGTESHEILCLFYYFFFLKTLF